MRTVPYRTYTAADGRTIRLAVDSDFWATDISGEDGLDLDISEQQSTGQIGTTVTGTSVGARPIVVTGAILRDLDANERLLKQLLVPGSVGRWTKTIGNQSWYVDVITKRSPDVSGGEHLLNFQFSLYAAYPYWRTEETVSTLLGGLKTAWFPTPVSTAGAWYISRYKQDLYTTVTNTGNTETDFTVRFTAMARVLNPMLWHNGKRTFIRLNKEMQAGERAVISTADNDRGCTCYAADGTEQDGFRFMDINTDWWMTLSPGDNVIRLTADEGRENLTASISAPKGVASSV